MKELEESSSVSPNWLGAMAGEWKANRGCFGYRASQRPPEQMIGMAWAGFSVIEPESVQGYVAITALSRSA